MTESDRLSVPEVVKRIEALSDDDYLRIVYIVRGMVSVTPSMSVDDYLNEAIARLLSGERTIPRGQDLCTCLITIMRSIANHVCERQARVDGEMPEDDVLSSEANDQLQDLIHAQTLDQLQNLVSQDQCAVDVLQLRAVGHQKEDICAQLNIKPTTYDSAIKRIRRAVLKYQQEAVT